VRDIAELVDVDDPGWPVVLEAVADGAVLFLADDEGAPALPGFVSEACCADRLPEAAGSVHCDALRLSDIVEQTGVEALMLHSYQGWARVPALLMHHTLQQRGRRAAGERLKLSRSTHRLALALRPEHHRARGLHRRPGSRWARRGHSFVTPNGMCTHGTV
jgi:hypothetical protein